MFRTGDLARLAGDGFVFEARIGDAMRLGGFLVSPEEIEAVIQAEPGVAGVQVVAASNGGRSGAGRVRRCRPRGGAGRGGIAGALPPQQLAPFKVPGTHRGGRRIPDRRQSEWPESSEGAAARDGRGAAAGAGHGRMNDHSGAFHVARRQSRRPPRPSASSAISGRLAQRLTGGASQETWAFDAVGRAGAVPLIMRRLSADAAPASEASAPECEAHLIRRAGECGVPTPGIRHILEPGDDLGRGFLSDRIEGGNARAPHPARCQSSPRYARGSPSNAARSCARIHAVPTDHLPPLKTRFAAGQL